MKPGDVLRQRATGAYAAVTMMLTTSTGHEVVFFRWDGGAWGETSRERAERWFVVDNERAFDAPSL